MRRIGNPPVVQVEPPTLLDLVVSNPKFSSLALDVDSQPVASFRFWFLHIIDTCRSLLLSFSGVLKLNIIAL